MCAVGMAEQGRGKNRGFFYHAISPSRHSRSLMLYSTFVHTAPPYHTGHTGHTADTADTADTASTGLLPIFGPHLNRIPS